MSNREVKTDWVSLALIAALIGLVIGTLGRVVCGLPVSF